MPSAAFKMEFDREEDGRWIAEIPQFPGALAYGETKREARECAHAIALRVIADRIEAGHSFGSVSRMFYEVDSH